MSKRLKPVPAFASESEERTFRETHESTNYVDWSKAKRSVLPNLQPTTNSISLRLPQHLLDAICAVPVADQGVAAGEGGKPMIALGEKLRTPWALEGPDPFDSID